jgi:hypothetical protein
VKQKYTIVGIETTEGCNGCRYRAAGQLDHMTCPHGCLHEASDGCLC